MNGGLTKLNHRVREFGNLIRLRVKFLWGVRTWLEQQNTGEDSRRLTRFDRHEYLGANFSHERQERQEISTWYHCRRFVATVDSHVRSLRTMVLTTFLNLSVGIHGEQDASCRTGTSATFWSSSFRLVYVQAVVRLVLIYTDKKEKIVLNWQN